MTRGYGSLTLVLAGLMSLAVSVLHFVMIFVGGRAYRYFGAGERMAMRAEGGSLWPAAITAALAIVFAGWAAYAFSGAQLMRRLPNLRAGLLVIGGIYTLRGLALIPQAALRMSVDTAMPARYLAFSATSLLIGITHLLGTRLAWHTLGDPKPEPRRPPKRSLKARS